MELESRLSHLIAKYKKALDKDPSSRVFAPLAECYRKAGMITDALVTLRDGLQQNPDSVLGQIGLAQCYADQGHHQKVYDTLRPLKETNLDNIKLQRLYAQSCLKLHKNEEALESYKYILFLSPSDKEAIEVVSSLEDEVYAGRATTSSDTEVSSEHFPIEKLEENSRPDKDLDEWEAVDFSGPLNESQEFDDLEANADEVESSWSMRPITTDVLDEDIEDPYLLDDVEDEKEKPSESTTEERSFKVLTSDKFQASAKAVEDAKESKPLITHTLVDLYCAQGHYEQAYQLLNKILELNPDDERTVQKLKEVQEFINFEDTALEKGPTSFGDESNDHEEYDGEEEAHEQLANLVESKVQVSKRGRFAHVQERLWAFHEKLLERSKEQRF